MSEDSTQQIPTTDPVERPTPLAPRTEHLMDSTTTGPATQAVQPTTDPTGTTPTAGWSDPAQAPPVEPAAAGHRSIRVGTVVWGLVVAAVGLGLVALASGLTFDVELAVIVLLLAEGLSLLVGSLATGLRHRGR